MSEHKVTLKWERGAECAIQRFLSSTAGRRIYSDSHPFRREYSNAAADDGGLAGHHTSSDEHFENQGEPNRGVWLSARGKPDALRDPCQGQSTAMAKYR